MKPIRQKAYELNQPTFEKTLENGRMECLSILALNSSQSKDVLQLL